MAVEVTLEQLESSGGSLGRGIAEVLVGVEGVFVDQEVSTTAASLKATPPNREGGERGCASLDLTWSQRS